MSHRSEDNFDGDLRDQLDDEGLVFAFYTYKISILAKKLDRYAAQIIEEQFGLKMNDWWVLANISPRFPIAVRDLVRTIHIDKSQISRSLARLIDMKLVRKEPDPTDARSPLFGLTLTGERIREAVMALRIAENEKLASLLDPSERTAFERALRRIDDFANARIDRDLSCSENFLGGE